MAVECVTAVQPSAAVSAWSGRRGRQFLLIILAATTAAYARFDLGSVQETMRIALSLSDNQMALLQGPALALPMAVAAVPLGLLIDRYSRTKLLLLFAVLNATGAVLTALATDFSVLFFARCLTGLAVAAISTTAFALLGDLFVPVQRGRATMLVVIGQYAGMSAAFGVGGYLVTLLGSGPQVWQRAMLWLSAPLIPVTVLMLAAREPARAAMQPTNATMLAIRITGRELWSCRARIIPALIGLILAEMGVLAALTWAAPAFTRHFGLGAARVGAIVAAALMVSGVVGPLVGGVLADLCQRKGGPRLTLTALATLTLLGVPGGLFGVIPSVALGSILLALFMTAVGAVIVMGIALFTIVVPNELRGLCVSVLAGAQVLFGVGLAPLLVSVLSGLLGGPATIGQALALIVVTTSVVGAGAFACGRRSFSPKTLTDGP